MSPAIALVPLRLRPARPELAWADEAQEERQRRRERLTQLDGLLFFVEEHNARHHVAETHRDLQPVPPRLLTWYLRLGGRRLPRHGADLMDCIFELQEPLLRSPEPPPPF